jgi:hypothetical protein
LRARVTMALALLYDVLFIRISGVWSRVSYDSKWRLLKSMHSPRCNLQSLDTVRKNKEKCVDGLARFLIGFLGGLGGQANATESESV